MKPSKNFQRLQEGTFEMLDFWMYNFARNLSDILDGKSVKTLSPFDATINSKHNHKSTGSAIVIGAGPSIKENQHLKTLYDSHYKGSIICTDRMLIPCLKNGITPDNFPQFYVVTIDPIQEISKFYDDSIVKKYGKKILGVLSTCTSPEVIEKCKENKVKIYWVHPLIDDYRKTSSINKIMNMMTKSIKNPKGFPGIQTGGNSGTASWVFSWAILGKSPSALIGINFGYSKNDLVEETPHYKEFIEISKHNEKNTKKLYKKFYNPDLKCEVMVDPIFDYYREAFCDLVQRTPSWIKTINATEGGSLFGKGIKNMKFSNFLKKFPK